MKSLLNLRGLCSSISVKGLDSFGVLAETLAPESKSPRLKKSNKSHKKSQFASVSVIKTRQAFEVRVQEPLTFAGMLENSPILAKLDFNEELSDQFLDHAADRLTKGKGDDIIDWKHAMEVIKKSEDAYPAPKVEVPELMKKPGIRPIFNLASVVNNSFTLQRLVDLGTKIGKWEEDDKLETALRLDFNADVAPRIQLLVDNGIKPDHIGCIFTENPDLFDQSLDDLKVRISYLKWRKFDAAQIKSIISISDSKWLNFSTLDIDARLGFMQKLFNLNNTQVKRVATTCPQLVIWKGTPSQLENNHTCLRHSMGFNHSELKSILLNAPEVLLEKDSDFIQNRFDILHNEIGFSHALLAQFAPALGGDAIGMKVRLKFLQKLGRDQFNPQKANYVSPEAFALFDDVTFCEKVAKAPVDLFNNFQKVA